MLRTSVSLSQTKKFLRNWYQNTVSLSRKFLMELASDHWVFDISLFSKHMIFLSISVFLCHDIFIAVSYILSNFYLFFKKKSYHLGTWKALQAMVAIESGARIRMPATQAGMVILTSSTFSKHIYIISFQVFTYIKKYAFYSKNKSQGYKFFPISVYHLEKIPIQHWLQNSVQLLVNYDILWWNLQGFFYHFLFHSFWLLRNYIVQSACIFIFSIVSS